MSSLGTQTDRYALATMEERCCHRTEVSLNAQLRTAGDRPFGVRVYNLSLAGFCCETVTALRRGARCWITMPGLSSLEAEVIWNDGLRIGCAFSKLIDVAVYDRIAARYR